MTLPEERQPRLIVRGWWWALDYVYAARRQLAVFTTPWTIGRPRPTPRAWRDGADDLPEIILLPGVYEHWTFLRPLGDALNAAGHRVNVVHGLGLNSRDIVETSERLARSLAKVRPTPAGRVLVAHSKGGLIGKRVMLGPSGWRVARLVAIATPFSGSEWGRVVPLRAVRALAPESPDVVSLAAETAVNARITSIYPLFDPHVPGGSELPGAENVRLPIAGHSRILADPIALRAVGRAVAGAADDVQRESDERAGRDH